ncbi:hypothetical protein [Brevibacillus dissolubilis]|uniref:hypothetical protein n=1 Tax=Brevibacillus dissolubilis TaxID=1844116 RepID=UPI00111696EB|nr:hypothetical protein [Brevibacillus dissolubilis]
MLRRNIILIFCAALITIMTIFPITSKVAMASTKIETDEAFLKIADPYVRLEPGKKQYQLQSDASKYLTAVELKKIKKILKQTNKEVYRLRKELIVSPENGKVLVPRNQTGNNNTGFMIQSINKKRTFDYEFTWWGLRMYWSHAFVQKLNSNLALYGAGVAGFNAALSATLSYFAITPPGWLTSFITATAGLSVWAFIRQDKGCGVYLDCIMYVPTRWYSAC